MNSNWREHQYGRITGGALESWLQLFERMWKEREEFSSIRDDPDQWANSFEKLVGIPNWVVLYEQDLLRLACTLIAHSGLEDGFVQAARAGGDALLQFVETLAEIPPPDEKTLADTLPAAMAMLGNLEAIAVYSRSVNDMVKAAKAGDYAALGEAVSIDAYVLCFPFFLAGIRIDQLSNQTEFAKDVFRAVCGPHRRRYEYSTLRWAEYLLRDQGAFEACSREELYILLAHHLKLYDAAGTQEDAKSALFAMFRKWQKQAGIQNPRFGFSGKKKA